MFFLLVKFIYKQSLKYLFERFSDEIIGLKLRMGKTLSDGLGLTPLIVTKDISHQIGCPICLHLKELTEFTYSEALQHLDKGDVLCHCYQAVGGHSMLTESKKISSAFQEARARGILFDSAIAGGTNHNLLIMQRAFAEGFYPDLMGTDIVRHSVYRNKTFGLLYIMSKHIALGMPLPEVIRACTETPARVMGCKERLGTLGPGANADIAILKIREKPIAFRDGHGNSIQGNHLLIPQVTVKNGRVVYKRIEFDL
jgi:dihydroorotase